ncbi:LysR substrate-binding domain-containing protein [Ruegeria denitrificans]|uniref:LysR substrate-binding domain-containing protein n=1 Tax=Ruegeria denitrificans TaxID=1715692 RepID=UPI0009EBD784|nr:LysR substrate-binding domain-containing protein [Ruegeria denitrificans]
MANFGSGSSRGGVLTESNASSGSAQRPSHKRHCRISGFVPSARTGHSKLDFEKPESGHSGLCRLPSASELAGRESLSAADIRDHPIFGFPKHARPILHNLLWNSYRAHGWQPDIACEVIDKSTMLQMVAHGVGIGLAPPGFAPSRQRI